MDALAELLQVGDPITELGGRPEQVLDLAHESRYWTRVATRFGVTLAPERQKCLVAMATLWGATDADQARGLLNAALPEIGPDALADIGDWLAALYQDGLYHDRQQQWSGAATRPVGRASRRDGVGVPRPLPGLLTGAVHGALRQPTRTRSDSAGPCRPQHPHLADTIAETVLAAGKAGGIAALTVATRLEQPQPVLDALHPLIATQGHESLWKLSGVLPLQSILLAPISLHITEALVTRLREAASSDPDAYLPDLAGSVNNLANRLAEVGRRAEGLAAAQEAVTYTAN